MEVCCFRRVSGLSTWKLCNIRKLTCHVLVPLGRSVKEPPPSSARRSLTVVVEAPVPPNSRKTESNSSRGTRHSRTKRDDASFFGNGARRTRCNKGNGLIRVNVRQQHKDVPHTHTRPCRRFTSHSELFKYTFVKKKKKKRRALGETPRSLILCVRLVQTHGWSFERDAD